MSLSKVRGQAARAAAVPDRDPGEDQSQEDPLRPSSVRLRAAQRRRAAQPGARLQLRGHPARHQRLGRRVVAGRRQFIFTFPELPHFQNFNTGKILYSTVFGKK